jgi:hypothetical protein
MRVTTSGRALFGVVATPLALTGLGAGAVPANRTIGMVWMAAGALLAVVAATDHPIRSWMDHEGLHRQCLLRHHCVGWDRVAAFELTRGRVVCLQTTTGRRYLVGDRFDPDALKEAVTRLCPSVVVRGCQSPARAGL